MDIQDIKLDESGKSDTLLSLTLSDSIEFRVRESNGRLDPDADILFIHAEEKYGCMVIIINWTAQQQIWLARTTDVETLIEQTEKLNLPPRIVPVFQGNGVTIPGSYDQIYYADLQITEAQANLDYVQASLLLCRPPAARIH